MLKLKEKMLLTNKDPKKEILNNVLINVVILLVSITTYLLTKNFMYFIYFGATLILFNFYYFSRYGRSLGKNNEVLVDDFIDTFTYFRIYVSNNRNVYMSLKEISNYSSPFIKGKLNELLNDIDEDKSLKPFLKFASYFHNRKVEEVMIAIYEMIDEGSNENYINQFIQTFMAFKLRVNKKREDKRNSNINLSITLSIVGVGILMILIMLGIISILGEIVVWVIN